MIASGLDGEKRAGMILDALAQGLRPRARRHDVGNLDLGRVQPAGFTLVPPRVPNSRISFLDIADHAENFRHGGELLGGDLGGAAGDDDFRARPLALDLADRLTGLARRLRRHRASVDDDEAAPPGG